MDPFFQENPTFTISFFGRFSVGINKFLLPIKISLFCWFAGYRSGVTFIPVYMKHQGLTIKHLSTIILLSVCFQFLVSAISGVLADKIGRVKPFLFAYLSVFLITLICFIIMPKVDECPTKNITFDCSDEESSHFTARDSCRNFQDTFPADACSVIKNGSTAYDDANSHCPFISILRQGSISIEKNHLNNISGLCLYQARSKNFSDTDISPCGTQNCKSFQIVCSGNDSDHDSTNCNHNRMVWIVIYCIVGVSSYTSLSGAHRCFDVISADLSNRQNSDFGKQRLWAILGSLAGPSLAGLILEKTASKESGKNYAPIFVWSILLTILSIVPLWNINPEFHKPATHLWKKSLELMKKLEIFLFFLLLLTAGISFGFQMMYGNWYLESLGASDLLIGISKGLSTLCGLPLLYASKSIFNKIGVRIFFVLSLLCYVVYSFAFSLMREPWLAMFFDLANVFGYVLFWPAVMQYCEEIAPLEMQATMKGMAGVLHFNVARIGASMIGGHVMNNYGGRTAYQVIGYICLGYAAVYGMDLIARHLRQKKTGARLKRDKCETTV